MGKPKAKKTPKHDVTSWRNERGFFVFEKRLRLRWVIERLSGRPMTDAEADQLPIDAMERKP